VRSIGADAKTGTAPRFQTQQMASSIMHRASIIESCCSFSHFVKRAAIEDQLAAAV
jgi:hypothetical protein